MPPTLAELAEPVNGASRLVAQTARMTSRSTDATNQPPQPPVAPTEAYVIANSNADMEFAPTCDPGCPRTDDAYRRRISWPAVAAYENGTPTIVSTVGADMPESNPIGVVTLMNGRIAIRPDAAPTCAAHSIQ
jgi:hypothetical protein